jgi:uncharacterized protein YoxC
MILSLLIAALGIIALVFRTDIILVIKKDSTTMATVHEQLNTLTAQVTNLAAQVSAIPAATPAVDLAPIQAEIDAIKADLGTVAPVQVASA